MVLRERGYGCGAIGISITFVGTSKLQVSERFPGGSERAGLVAIVLGPILDN